MKEEVVFRIIFAIVGGYFHAFLQYFVTSSEEIQLMVKLKRPRYSVSLIRSLFLSAYSSQ